MEYNRAMKSPFPGMDPYLEQFWNDVHGPLIPYIKEALNESLPNRYRAAMQKRVIITDLDDAEPAVRYPDVAIVQSPAITTTAEPAVRSSRAVVRAPEIFSYQIEPLTEYSIEILDSESDDRIITAIEILSRENKRPGDGMVQFRKKQIEYWRAGISRVEIDLLRTGRRMFEFPQRMLGANQIKPYYVAVHRGAKPGECELYSIDLRDPLPAIGVPLRIEEPDVILELQPLIERVYRTSRFPINYDTPCEPPLEGEDAVWARQMLNASKSKA